MIYIHIYTYCMNRNAGVQRKRTPPYATMMPAAAKATPLVL